MKILKYFFEFIFIYIFLFIFKIIGYENASNLGEKIGMLIGPMFRSKKTRLLFSSSFKEKTQELKTRREFTR